MFRKFPSIDQFRHVVDDVNHRAWYVGQDANDQPTYDQSRQRPVLPFVGTVKLHGTNGGISFDYPEGNWEAQSRESVLSLEADNHGFCAFVDSLGDGGRSNIRHIFEAAAIRHFNVNFQEVSFMTIFGEWCGKRVNGKTGIGQLPDRFVIFQAVIRFLNGDERWLPIELAADLWHENHLANDQVFFITDFKKFHVDIDFSDPAQALDHLEALTLEVEQSCPVATAMGGAGIGEGIVWVCSDPVYGRMVFKTKGDKHKGTKNRRLVDIAPEVLASRQAFVDAVLTESRLQQGADLIRQRNGGKLFPEHTTDFIIWVGGDVLKEESDTLEASGLDRKDVMKAVNRGASDWYKANVDKC